MLAEVIEGTFVDTAGIRSQSPTKEDSPSPRSEEVSVGGIISEAHTTHQDPRDLQRLS